MHNRSVWYNNTDWRVCGALNGRIRTQTPRGEAKIWVYLELPHQCKKHSLKAGLFLLAALAPLGHMCRYYTSLGIFLWRVHIKLRASKCADCTSFWLKMEQFILWSLTFLLIKCMAYNGGVADKKVENRERFKLLFKKLSHGQEPTAYWISLATDK